MSTSRSRIRTRLARGAVSVALALGGAVGLQVATAQPASAYASGCSSWGDIPYLGIPTGYECFTVYGSGLNISSMYASWRTGSLCNWRIDWIIDDRYGNRWWTSTGPTHWGCDSLSGSRTRGSGWGPAYSRICARVYSYNTRIESVCHTLEP